MWVRMHAFISHTHTHLSASPRASPGHYLYWHCLSAHAVILPCVRKTQVRKPFLGVLPYSPFPMQHVSGQHTHPDNPVVFMDVAIGGVPAGRLKMARIKVVLFPLVYLDTTLRRNSLPMSRPVRLKTLGAFAPASTETRSSSRKGT